MTNILVFQYIVPGLRLPNLSWSEIASTQSALTTTKNSKWRYAWNVKSCGVDAASQQFLSIVSGSPLKWPKCYALCVKSCGCKVLWSWYCFKADSFYCIWIFTNQLDSPLNDYNYRGNYRINWVVICRREFLFETTTLGTWVNALFSPEKSIG